MRFTSMLAAAIPLLVVAPAAAQDPPPPLPPADVPPPLPPADVPPATPVKPAVPAPPAAAPVDPPQPEAVSPARGDDARTLKGHTFRPPLSLGTVFVGTHVGLQVGLGREVTGDVHAFATSGTGGTQELVYDISQTVITGRVQAGYGLFGRAEIGIEGAYSGFIAGDQNTAILFGGQSGFDLRPGVRLVALRAPSSGTQIGLHAYGAFGGLSRLNPQRALSAVAENIKDIAGDVGRSACLAAGDLACALGETYDVFAEMRVSRATYGGGLTAGVAQAIGKRAGLQAELGIELARASSSTRSTGDLASTPVTFHVGVAPSVDFGPAVPIGLMAEYRFDFSAESYSSSSGAIAATSTRTVRHGIAAGLYYTARRDLTIGAAFQGAFFSTSTDAGSLPSTSLLSGVMTTRYYF